MILYGISERKTLLMNAVALFLHGVAAVASIWLAWGAAELLYAPLPDHEGCGCFVKLGFLQTVATMASPATLSVLFFGKAADLVRSAYGGDHMLTMRYHISHRLLTGKGIDPTGSALGMLGLG